MLGLPLTVKSILVLSALSIVLQTTPLIPQDASGFIDQISKIGVTGLLALAVVVLYRDGKSKDAIIMENSAKMADSLAANNIVNEKMLVTLEAIKDTVNLLNNVRVALDRHPQ